MKKLFAIAFAFAPLVSVNATQWTFDLQGRSGAGMRFDNENPTAAGSGTGGEVGSGILYDDVSNLMTINIRWGSGGASGFSDLTGNVTAAHIHQAPDALFTSNGGNIEDLHTAAGFNASNTSGGWTNTPATLTAGEETALFNGFLYFNAHTSANPGGEIRGNLVNPLVVPEPSSLGLLALGLTGFASIRRRKASAA